MEAEFLERANAIIMVWASKAAVTVRLWKIHQIEPGYRGLTNVQKDDHFQKWKRLVVEKLASRPQYYDLRNLDKIKVNSDSFLILLRFRPYAIGNPEVAAQQFFDDLEALADRTQGMGNEFLQQLSVPPDQRVPYGAIDHVAGRAIQGMRAVAGSGSNTVPATQPPARQLNRTVPEPRQPTQTKRSCEAAPSSDRAPSKNSSPDWLTNVATAKSARNGSRRSGDVRLVTPAKAWSEPLVTMNCNPTPDGEVIEVDDPRNEEIEITFFEKPAAGKKTVIAEGVPEPAVQHKV